MSTFYQKFSDIHFTSQCLLFERAVDITVSLYYNKNVGSPFFVNSPFKISLREVFRNKTVPKKFRKTHRKLYEIKGCWLKRDSGAGAFLYKLRGVFRTISNIYDEAFIHCIFAEMLHHRYLARV